MEHPTEHQSPFSEDIDFPLVEGDDITEKVYRRHVGPDDAKATQSQVDYYISLCKQMGAVITGTQEPDMDAILKWTGKEVLGVYDPVNPAELRASVLAKIITHIEHILPQSHQSFQGEEAPKGLLRKLFTKQGREL